MSNDENTGLNLVTLTTDRIEKIPVGVLTVDMDVQRALNSTRVEAMVDTFKKEALGVITVSARDDGTMVIVDGQHRWAAAQKYGLTKVPCLVYKGLEKSEEAALFRVLNNTKIVSPLDRFRVRVVEGEPTAVTISNLLAKEGWKIPLWPNTKSAGLINSVGSLEWVYTGAGIKPNTKQYNNLANTIQVITAAWGYDSDGMRADLVRGVGLFLTRFEGQVDFQKVVRMLATYVGGPLRLQADGRLFRTMRASTAGDAIAAIMVNLYNHKRKTNRLPEWFTTSRIQDGPTEEDG